jgi:5-methylcytosine-specific restriction enzyme subunit McrC
MRRVTLRERGRLHRLRPGRNAPHADTADAAWLDARRFDRLRDYDRTRNDGAVFDWGVEDARAGQWVGVVQVPGLVLELLPKIDAPPGHGEDTVDLARDNLLAMLAEAGEIPLRARDLAALSTRRAPLHETLVALFARRMLSELSQGPHRSYVGETDDLRALRGKLLVGRHVARNAARRERFTCAFEEFSVDTALGRVLRATCRTLLDCVSQGGTREALGRCLALLDDVADVPDGRAWFDRVVLDRQSQRFTDLLAFCRLVLEQQTPTSRSGTATTFSLLFDMDRVFEGFVAAFLRRKVMPRFEGVQLRVQGQGARAPLLRTEREQGALYLKPDLLLTTRGSGVAEAVLDTKWKRLGAMTQRKQAGLGAADLYQMFAYTRRYDVARSVLLFPWVAGSVERDFHVMGPGDTREGSRICVRFVDLRRSLRRTADREALADDLAEVLRRTLVAA